MSFDFINYGINASADVERGWREWRKLRTKATEERANNENGD